MSNIAYAMFCKNEYYFTKKEFDEFVIGYHQKLGYKIEDTEFDTLFFEKNILCVSGDLVFFSHTSILEYYLALYAKNNRSFLDYMLRKGNRTNFKNEICFYSGLTPNCKDLLDGMAETIMEEICENINIIDELNEIEIMTDFKLDKEEIRQKIYDNRLSQTELDSLHDNYSVKEVEPLKLDKKNMQQKEAWNDEKDYQEGSAEDFISLLLMYGSVLKNAELLDNKDKVYHLENYMYAMNILLGKLLQYAFDKKSEFGINEVKEVIGNDEALSNINELDQKQWNDVWKIAFPIAVQKLISENVGTPKLELAIDELMKRKNEKPFEKFMFTFLKCDLGIGDIVSIIRKYIGDEKSSSILKMIFIKLVFYIAIRFFGGDYHKENEIVDLIIETDLKINPEEKVRKAYNANRELARKKVLGEIQKTGLLQKK